MLLLSLGAYPSANFVPSSYIGNYCLFLYRFHSIGFAPFRVPPVVGCSAVLEHCALSRARQHSLGIIIDVVRALLLLGREWDAARVPDDDDDLSVD